VLGPGLGSATRLSYHEAIQAEQAREVLASGDWLVPTLGGRPWLEKPPLAVWATAALGRITGRVGALEARGPGACAGVLLALAVAGLAAGRFGAPIGLLAGMVQLTTAWLATRARLAEPDVPLAAVVAGALLAFDRVRQGGPGWRGWRLGFFALLGGSAGLKGVGFGGALIGATAVAALAWDRDRAAARALLWPPGWALAGLIALAWPLAVLARHPGALGLWLAHTAGRLAERPEGFAGEPWWEYAPAPLAMLLPWTPLAFAGAWRSWGRARRPEGRGGADRLLWAWAVVPSGLVSLASARNAHYLVHALPPASAWAALGLARAGERLAARGWGPSRRRRAAWGIFAALGLAWGVGSATLGPWLDRRGKGAEWAFYERAGRALDRGVPVALLYDALDRPDRWDRLPYPTPFGPVPPDLAVRLFYLDRPVDWAFGPGALAPLVRDRGAVAVVARERDRPALERLGRVERVMMGPSGRWDRTFAVYRIEARGAGE
jgi:4-amino-4-deoxy-L-arabinose transferase-like glycosyltransferase